MHELQNQGSGPALERPQVPGEAVGGRGGASSAAGEKRRKQRSRHEITNASEGASELSRAAPR